MASRLVSAGSKANDAVNAKCKECHKYEEEGRAAESLDKPKFDWTILQRVLDKLEMLTTKVESTSRDILGSMEEVKERRDALEEETDKLNEFINGVVMEIGELTSNLSKVAHGD